MEWDYFASAIWRLVVLALSCFGASAYLLDSEPSPESSQLGALRFCGGALHLCGGGLDILEIDQNSTDL